MPADVQLTVAYHRRLLALRARAGATIGSIFDRFAGPSDQALEEYVRHAAPILAGARVGAVQVMAGYLTAMLAAAPRIDQTAVLASIRSGASLDDVLARSIITMRTKLAEGADLLDAEHVARLRATSTAETDVMLANRAAGLNGMANEPRIRGYRRVLSGTACELCASAAGETYSSDGPMPMHPRCDCGTAPIIGANDPARMINRQVLSNLATRGGSPSWDGRFKIDDAGAIVHADGAPLNVAVHEHGELGPVLTDRADVFTGPQDL